MLLMNTGLTESDTRLQLLFIATEVAFIKDSTSSKLSVVFQMKQFF